MPSREAVRAVDRWAPSLDAAIGLFLVCVGGSQVTPLVGQALTAATQGLRTSARQLLERLASHSEPIAPGDRVLWQLVRPDYERLENKVHMVSHECQAREHLLHCLSVTRRFLVEMAVLPADSRPSANKRLRDDSDVGTPRGSY